MKPSDALLSLCWYDQSLLVIVVLLKITNKYCVLLHLGLDAKTRLWGFVNNKGADQLACPHRLISAFTLHILESIISKLATREI